MSFKDFDWLKKYFDFRSENCIFIHNFESISHTYSEFLFLFCKKFKLIKGRFFYQNFLMSKKNIVLLKLSFKVFINDFLAFSLKIILGFKFVKVFLKTVNVIVELIKLFVEFFKGPSVNVSEFSNNNWVQDSKIAQRLKNCFRIKKFRRFLRIGLDTPNKVTITWIKLLN